MNIKSLYKKWRDDDLENPELQARLDMAYHSCSDKEMGIFKAGFVAAEILLRRQSEMEDE